MLLSKFGIFYGLLFGLDTPTLLLEHFSLIGFLTLTNLLLEGAFTHDGLTTMIALAAHIGISEVSRCVFAFVNLA